MNETFKRSLYYIFILCAFLGFFMVAKLDSFAYEKVVTLRWSNGTRYKNEFVFSCPNDIRYGAYAYYNDNYNGLALGNMVLYTNSSSTITGTLYSWVYDEAGNLTSYNGGVQQSYTPQFYSTGIYYFSAFVNNSFYCSDFISSDQADVLTYVSSGVRPELPFDDTLKLDSFKVTSWQVGNVQAIFQSKFECTWSDSRITTVQVKLESTALSNSFESSVSPMNGKFRASQYVMRNGDVIHLTATPYKSDGSYGESLYCFVTYNDKIPFSNVWRKLTNTPNSNNVLTIPYTPTGSNEPTEFTVPVDGVTETKVYKVHYNPTTNEYNNQNVYEIQYSPVIIFPSGTTDTEVDDVQDVITNNYTTNNYYTTTNEITVDFDINFDDVSNEDIKQGYDDFGNFASGFGGFIGKLSQWILALFPFLSPVVASTIVIAFGLVVAVAVIAFLLKIVSVIADLLPF